MLTPPFKLAVAAAASATALAGAAAEALPAGEPGSPDPAAAGGRPRLGELNPHFHCSVIGTCLSTPELRRLMSRFVDVQGLSDLEIHHEAVRLSGRPGPVVKALNKALDQRHEAAVQRLARTHEPAELIRRWEESLRQGEVPGAYWALLTHRDATTELRQRVFGDVHMLSHLVGAANRADIRRLVALEGENGELRDKLDRQAARCEQLVEERDALKAERERDAIEMWAGRTRDEAAPREPVDTQALVALAALQTGRREQAEARASAATDEARLLRLELDHLRAQLEALGRELSATELQLREWADEESRPPSALASRLEGRRILYVGGRPSSTPAIRELVRRHGGEFQRHDGGIEDRKGLLESALAWADLVSFPVDCVDHDSASRLKRSCVKAGKPYLPLRSASVASFAAAVSAYGGEGKAARPALCLRHA